MLVGAGTIMDREVARKCVDAGASFLIRPGLDLAIIEFATKNESAVLGGALTPTEVVTAWRAGSDFVKVFPCAQVGGDSYIKALKARIRELAQRLVRFVKDARARMNAHKPSGVAKKSDGLERCEEK
jgi:2-dehydro-3-deoxyphosphogluconate aldolase/(4S)-4-hydroxy-2-oxoglutarate aldolase